ncbi:HAD hydrolase-like protein [Nesterenkonia flava]|uniref:HAD hydrolase-like protein n=1 Tax=Nesterenkonia flava TaxID=469799 RepID=A0ABU1FS82_9MICC|nr:HAD hydrolase-like protein [Nesterenkonia flava]MDR5711510.1 HAD hydrolase-like protein [Nesterenkonia flava]
MTTRIAVFDLDGTLVDPAGAITGGISAALRDHGIGVPDEETLKSFIGPPLAASLRALPGVTEELVPKLIERYRDGYIREGMAASRVYPGIEELLKSLRAAGVHLAVATSKPEPQATRLLQIQGLLDYFAVVSGSDPDETVPHTSKGPIIASALERLRLDAEQHVYVVMVGDRKFDVEGAARQGLPCIGVSWGYAPEGELEEEGAVAVVSTAEQLREVIDDQFRPLEQDDAAQRTPVPQ